MGIGSKEKVNDSVKNDKEFLDKEKDKKEFNEISKRDEINETKEERLKNYDKDNKLIQETEEEKKVSKWDKIDWNKDISDEIKESKWDKIDWNKDTSDEKKKFKWDKIDWNEDIYNEKKESSRNNEYSDNEKIGGYINNNLKDNMMFIEDEDKKVKKLKDFNEEFESKEIEGVNLGEKKDKVVNKYIGKKLVKEFRKDGNEERVKMDLLESNGQNLDEREKILENPKEFIETMKEVDMKNEINKNYYKNLLNDDLHKAFNEYLNETGNYANWGTKIRKDFISELNNKINNKNITENDKESLIQIMQICRYINEKHVIKNLIIDKIEKKDLSYEDILKEMEEIGLNISLATISRISERELGKNHHKIKQGKWAFLDFDIEGKLLSNHERIQKAAEFLKNNILNDTFKKKYGLEEGMTPSIGLKDRVLNEFRGAISYRDLKYKDILKEAELKTNVKIKKWSFLEKDSKGNPLNYDQAIEKAAEYLTREILIKDFNTEYGIRKGEAPPRDIKNSKVRKFISAIGNRNLSYNDILEKSGLKINLDIGKWSFLDKDSKGNPLNYDQAIEKAAEYFTREILTKDFNIRYGIGKGEAPTIAMNNNKLKTFRGAIANRDLSYNDILEKVGLIPNLEKGKWSFLDKDSKDNPLNYDQAIQKAAEYLTQEILTNEFRDKYNFGIQETPTMNTNDKELKKFFSAISKRNLSYNDILENAGYKAHMSAIFNRVGNNMHVIQEKLFLQHTRKQGCFTFYEPYTNIYTQKGNANGSYKEFGLNHGDNCAIINDNLKTLSNEMKKLCDTRKEIKMIIVDYYLGNSEKTAKIHCLRGYQGKEKMLILVPTHANRQQSPPTGIPYRKNVKILDPLSFSNLMGYKGDIKEVFMKSLKLTKDATWKNNGSKETLEQLANESNSIIKDKYNYGYKDLKEFVKSQNSNISKDILKYDPDKSFIDYYL